MASSKEIQHSSRPLNQHRLSVSTNLGSLPRSTHSRNHSHSISGGSIISSNRVTRRKSVSSNISNVAAMVAAAKEAGDKSPTMPITTRRGTMSKSVSRSGTALGSLPSPPSSLPSHKTRLNSVTKSEIDESAIDDENNEDDDMEDEDDDLTKNRMRRASEGSQLMKDGKKANANDLKCDKCGKGYKHSSCLSKHLWEHTPQWKYTAKLLISKHQQVQLLEAASVLVTMNQDANTPPDSAKDFQSDDQDSASPTGSGSDDHDIDLTSSADTTPPPADLFHGYGSAYNPAKRYSNDRGYSRAYQSSSGPHYLHSGSAPSGFGHHRHQSRERRPPSSGLNGNQEDEGLSTAIELLSCSFGSTGTPRSGLLIPEDAPPVPDIPARYIDDYSASPFARSLHPRQTESYTRHQIHIDEDVKMEESEDSMADDEDYDRRSRGRSDEDDDGVFGRMEE